MRGRPAESSAYCSNVVQLWFNAWHFIDANLWASLAAEIFDGLGERWWRDESLHDDPRMREEARAKLLAAAASAKDVLAEARAAEGAGGGGEAGARRKIKGLRASDKEIARELGGATLAKAAYDVVIEQPGVEQKLKEAATTLKIPELQAGGADMQTQLLELTGLFASVKATVFAFKKNPRLLLRFGLTVAVLLAAAVFAVPPLVAWLKENGVPRTFSGLGAALTSLAALLGPYIVKARRALALVQETTKGQEQLIDAEKKKREDELKARQSRLPDRIKAAQQQRAEAQKKIDDLERQLADWRADKRMADFLHERRESTDYTQHLGVVARARRDFERLSKLLADSAKEGPVAGGIPRIDRIVLYIDDLDRCPENKVVDVLQAVHLLLAFPLFVVVVGVDRRWLLRSLTTYARSLRTDTDDDLHGMSDEERVHWRSTPLNYLEKIFQIPFALRPMPKTGFDNLIADLVPDVLPVGQASAPIKPPPMVVVEAGAARAADVIGPNMMPAAAPPKVPPHQPATGTPPPAAPQAAAPPPPEIDMRPAHLQIPEHERRFIQSLYALIPTPRAAKRLVNVYRLLRATLEEKDWERLSRRAVPGGAAPARHAHRLPGRGDGDPPRPRRGSAERQLVGLHREALR